MVEAKAGAKLVCDADAVHLFDVTSGKSLRR
jgi:hypothetical protein